MIDHLLGIDVPEETVDGEIAAQCIFALVGESDRFGSSAIRTADVGPKSGHFHFPLRLHHSHHSELGTDQDRLLEQLIDGIRDRRGREVEVLGHTPQQVIPHRTSGQQ